MVLAVLVAVLLLALAGLLVVQSYRDALDRSESEARTAAHTVSAHVQWLVEAGRQALRRIDQNLGADLAGAARSDRAGLGAALDAVPARVAARVFDERGALLASSEGARPTAPSAADADHFLALRDGAEWVFTPLMTDGATGEKVFAIGRRLERDGDFRGAAFLVVPAVVMADFWSALSLGPGSTVSIVRDDGWLVARFPVPEKAIDLSGSALFTKHLPESPVGSYRSARSPADGVSRAVGYRRVEGAPLVALASVSNDTALDAFWKQLRGGGLVLLPLLGGLLLLALWVSRLLRRDERNRRELAGANEKNQLLFREIHHRVKNNLQAVASLVGLQPISAEAKALMRSRISAMAAVHEHIYNSDQFASVNAGEYLGKLAHSLQAGHTSSAVRIETDAEAAAVDPDDAMSLGLIVNEVVSNALKHAFPDGRAGTVRIRFRAAAGGRASLVIRDDGVGFNPAVPGKGMGLRLIGGLAERLGAEWRFSRKDGTAFDMSFPLRAAADGSAG